MIKTRIRNFGLKFSLAFLLIFLASSCAKIESPTVYFSNASSEPIKDIQCQWADKLLKLPSLEPGDSRSQLFYLRDVDDFFGTVAISWRTNRGEKILREFIFRENNLPSIKDRTTYNYVQFYIDQEEMEIVSSDAPDLPGKTRKMEKVLDRYKALYSRRHHNVDNSLVTVDPVPNKEPKSVPYWLMIDY